MNWSIIKTVEYYSMFKKYDLIMDEDMAAIDANTRNQKIKDFFVKFKKHIIFYLYNFFSFNLCLLYLCRYTKKK